MTYYHGPKGCARSPLSLNVFSYCRMCSLTIECVLLPLSRSPLSLIPSSCTGVPGSRYVCMCVCACVCACVCVCVHVCACVCISLSLTHTKTLSLCPCMHAVHACMHAHMLCDHICTQYMHARNPAPPDFLICSSPSPYRTSPSPLPSALAPWRVTVTVTGSEGGRRSTHSPSSTSWNQCQN